MALAFCLRSFKPRCFKSQLYTRCISSSCNNTNIHHYGAKHKQTISTPNTHFANQMGRGRWFSGATDRNVIVTYEDLQALMQSKDIQLIDVREPNELIEFGKIPGSVNIPLGQLQTALQMSDGDFKALYGAIKPAMQDENVVYHCMIGGRSLKAVELSDKLGYNKTRHYKGGWEEYAEKTGQPIKRTK